VKLTAYVPVRGVDKLHNYAQNKKSRKNLEKT
jgi:hypothetical protein